MTEHEFYAAIKDLAKGNKDIKKIKIIKFYATKWNVVKCYICSEKTLVGQKLCSVSGDNKEERGNG